MHNPSIKNLGSYSYDMNAQLGKGAFATVFRGFDNNTRTAVAVKVVSLIELHNKYGNAGKPYLLQEITLMREMSAHNHESILRLHYDVESGQSIFLVMELCAIDLQLYLKKHKQDHKLSEDVARYYLLQLINGLKFLNENHIIHRDLKPANILLLEASDYSVLKIADFGLSKKVIDLAESSVGSPLYMAPEVLAKIPYTYKYDVWSTGCIFFEMLAGCPPFVSAKCMDSLAALQRTPIADLLRIQKCVVSGMALSLLKGLLTVDSEKRWDWNDALNCEYFAKNNLALSTCSFPTLQPEKKPEQVVAKPTNEPVKIEVPKEIIPQVKIDQKLQQIQQKVFLFSPHGIEKTLILRAGSTYTIQNIKSISRCENHEIFDFEGNLLRNDMVIFSPDPEKSREKIEILYFVDFSAIQIPYKYPPLHELNHIDEQFLVNLTGQAKIKALLQTYQVKQQNMVTILENSKIVTRQFYFTLRQIEIQKKIITVCLTCSVREMKNLQAAAKKCLLDYNSLTTKIIRIDVIYDLINQLGQTKTNLKLAHLSNLVNSLYSIINQSNKWKEKIEALLVSLNKTNESISVEPSRGKPYDNILKHKKTLDDVVKNYMCKSPFTIEEFTSKLKEIETPFSTMNHFPSNQDFSKIITGLELDLKTQLHGIYTEFLKHFKTTLDLRSMAESEKDLSAAEYYTRLKSLGAIFHKIKTFEIELKQIISEYNQFQVAVDSCTALELALSEYLRRISQETPLGRSVTVCETIVDRELLQREAFDTLFSNPILAKLVTSLKSPDSWPSPQEQISASEIERRQSDVNSKFLEELKNILFNNKTKQGLHISNLTQQISELQNKTKNIDLHTKDIIVKLKEIEEVTNLDVQFKVESQKCSVVSNNPNIQSLTSELESQALREKETIKMLEEALLKEKLSLQKEKEKLEKQISFLKDFIGKTLYSAYEKRLEDIKPKLNLGSNSNAEQKFQMWALKAYLDALFSDYGKTEEDTVRSALNWLENNKDCLTKNVDFGALKNSLPF